MNEKDAVPEKYYFRNGKIIQVMFRDVPQRFSAEQNAYYERTYGGDPKTCMMKGKSPDPDRPERFGCWGQSPTVRLNRFSAGLE